MIITDFSSLARFAETKTEPAKSIKPDKKDAPEPAKASSDSVDLSVSAKMTSQLYGLKEALENIRKGIGLVTRTDSYLSTTEDAIQKIRALAVKGANGTFTNTDRQHFQVEVSALIDEVDRIASQAEFNRFKLLTGSFSKNNPYASMWLHVGPNMNQRERIYIGTMTARSLHLKDNSGRITASVSTPSGANQSIGVMDSALQSIAKQRADMLGYSERLKVTSQEVMRSMNAILKSGDAKLDHDAAAELMETIKYLKLDK
ncbi:MAG: flagellin [Spirochaetes bacterium]|nr:MAG: flagellin [Spirochaetota bacterium]